MDFKNFSLLELSDLIQTGKTTSEEIYTYFLERVKRYNEELGAFTTLPSEQLPRPAGTPSVEGEWQSSKLPRPQPSNLPIAIKDIFCETGVRTTAGSKMLENFVPPYESTVTDRLKKAGYL